MLTFTRLLVLSLALPALLACTSPQKSEPAAIPGTPAPLPRNEKPPAPTRPAAGNSTLQPANPSGDQNLLALRMNTGRAAHTATLLSDGKVLIAGGFREEGTREIPIASAEVYDPATNTFTPTGDLNEARTGHTATRLPDGGVLIVGGWEPNGRTATAEIYDPQAGAFRFTAALSAPRAGMTATRMENGTVLIAGGESARNTPQRVAEIYDPATGAFSPTGSLTTGRSAHSATLLDDGSVLFAGGSSTGNTVLSSAEIYLPTRGEFTETGGMETVRYKHAAVLLKDGNVLLIGGSNNRDWEGKYSSAEIYQPMTGTFLKTADLNRERFKLADAVVLLANGDVLIGGGNRAIEIFDPQMGQFHLNGVLGEDYFYSVATLLENGCVLITGGYDGNIQPTDNAWIYNPSKHVDFNRRPPSFSNCDN